MSAIGLNTQATQTHSSLSRYQWPGQAEGRVQYPLQGDTMQYSPLFQSIGTLPTTSSEDL